MYWLLLASKNSARGECTVNILLLQYLFYCLPLKMFEHFFKASFKQEMLLTGVEGENTLLMLSVILSAVY